MHNIETAVSLPLQVTEADSKWLQLCTPVLLYLQPASPDSVPLHCTLSKNMGPDPMP